MTVGCHDYLYSLIEKSCYNTSLEGKKLKRCKKLIAAELGSRYLKSSAAVAAAI